jgi:hypothetical protein
VLTWLALRYTKHDDVKNLSSYLKIYDEVDPHQSESDATGGRAKGDNFSSQLFPTFASDPLNRLLIVVRKTFSARYGKTYSDEEIKKVRDHVAHAESYPGLDPALFFDLPQYVYGCHMEALEKPNWLVDVFNEHLKSDDWPLSDKANANPLISSTGSAQKRASAQAALEDRALGSNSKRRR